MFFYPLSEVEFCQGTAECVRLWLWVYKVGGGGYYYFVYDRQARQLGDIITHCHFKKLDCMRRSLFFFTTTQRFRSRTVYLLREIVDMWRRPIYVGAAEGGYDVGL